MREFHILRSIRRNLGFDETLFQTDGNIIFANFLAVRKFTQKLNESRVGLTGVSEFQAKSSDINAIGLIDEIFHYIIHLYQNEISPNLFSAFLDHLHNRFEQDEIDSFLSTFVDIFPPSPVFTGKKTVQEYLEDSSKGVPNRLVVLEELLIIWLANTNPAYSGYIDLFNDELLQNNSVYAACFAELKIFVKKLPVFGPHSQNLIEMLQSPAAAEPFSISGQLEYIKKNWGFMLGDLLLRLLSSLDLLKEEEKLGMLGPGPIEIPLYDLSSLDLLDGERYSQDKDWMPNLVMIAKNTYVWLHQMSVKYQRPIRLLSEIPDEELFSLAKWGINGLWLIGLWERSQASARIKQLCGNPEAISSAYALHDYQIASDLGGEHAFQQLDQRARKYGIRLASDMVPNHTAIDSRWMHDHPDWFLSLPYSPFPAYQFSGPDLSSSQDYSVFIEDHYYDRKDAAVVFKRVDRHNGDERFIYHGNDGTSFPWNDTAQLNYLNPEVREAVINTILEVARRFHVIRFDAAMTLTKRHFHRLWFPEPGSGGDIPSRAEHAMSAAEFNQHMPQEFWREVVERIGKEAPDTLLLAEAFWLMESYFVRTLGMHRVYNSAFMNLLRDESNVKYRQIMKNTLEFDPEILKRFVNFQNNPDERTAVDQFGNGDKYFGVCTLMVTMPGLPMFGHGQIEGFTEKYGMEYRRSYWDETVDMELVQRHEREIFPLLHKRYLFAHVENFLLYDYYSNSGYVNEDVFAYSNRAGHEAALVLYNNCYRHASGWVRLSVGQAQKSGEQTQIVQKSLAEGLNIRDEDGVFTIFRDEIAQKEYIRKNIDIINGGLYFDLNAYQSMVILDIRQIKDEDHSLQELHDYLGGEGVGDIEEARRELVLQPVLQPLRALLGLDVQQQILNAIENPLAAEGFHQLVEDIQAKTTHLVQGVSGLIQNSTSGEEIIKKILRKFVFTIQLFDTGSHSAIQVNKRLKSTYQKVTSFLKINLTDKLNLLFPWVFMYDLGRLLKSDNFAFTNQTWFEEWHLGDYLSGLLRPQQSAREITTQASMLWLKLMLSETPLTNKVGGLSDLEFMQSRLRNPLLQQLLSINRFNDILWFSKENFEFYINWERTLQVIQFFTDTQLSYAEAIEKFLQLDQMLAHCQTAAALANFQVEKMLEILGGQFSTGRLTEV